MLLVFRLYGEDHDFNLDEVLKEISYFRGSAYYIKEFCFDGHVKCPTSGFTQLAKRVRPAERVRLFVHCVEHDLTRLQAPPRH